jgi:hypothetical protein
MRSSKISTIRRGARMRFGRGGFPTVGDAVPYARNSKMLGNRINGDRPMTDPTISAIALRRPPAAPRMSGSAR